MHSQGHTRAVSMSHLQAAFSSMHSEEENSHGANTDNIAKAHRGDEDEAHHGEDSSIDDGRPFPKRHMSVTEKVSGLTLLLAGDAAEHRVRGDTSEAVQILSSPIDIKVVEDADMSVNDDPNRKWCTGLPPKSSYLPVSPIRSTRRVRGPMTRRSTLAEKPELDYILRAAMEMHNGKLHLPLSADSLHRLSSLWKGEKPIADYTIFERIVIESINMVHADHFISALECVGSLCKHLLIIVPINTSEYGDVFDWKADNTSTANDWATIFKYFCDIRSVTLEVPAGEPDALTQETYRQFHKAISRATFLKEPIVNISAPRTAILQLHPDMVDAAPAEATSASVGGGFDEVEGMEE
ncbi:hypothetical protein P280DRAFT_33828 [Massarina eburnea CBS 473.64]|uniref:Uncharacterized protein n=1 Tax=Massarina eburnea CBS 473.64 TaxID=1395130 RepID=A0A6A6RXS7_9PLEO|nr:hypothetical protein P280DRAFT_33828 [Massarina eburnea CBS 473.64]